MDKQKRRKERREGNKKHEVRQTKGGRNQIKTTPHKQQKQHSTQKKAKYKKIVNA
jgi:hypothetical protein